MQKLQIRSINIKMNNAKGVVLNSIAPYIVIEVRDNNTIYGLNTLRCVRLDLLSICNLDYLS